MYFCEPQLHRQGGIILSITEEYNVSFGDVSIKVYQNCAFVFPFFFCKDLCGSE